MTIKIPLSAFKAVQFAKSTEGTRYYLCGVFVEDTKLTATNGHILLTYDLWETPTGVGEASFILSVDINEKALKPRNIDNVYMHVDLERLIIETYRHDEDGSICGSRLGVCAFEKVDGNFPDVKRVIPKNNGENISTFSFNADNVSTMSKAAKVFNSKPLLKFENGPTEGSPALIKFGFIPELLGVIMPMKWSK